MNTAEGGSEHSINEIADALNDGISALGHEPDQQFDSQVALRVFAWIKHHWENGDEDYIDCASSLLANIGSDVVDDFLREAANNDPRSFARDSAAEVLRELDKTI